MLAAGWGGAGSVSACMDVLSFDMPRELRSVSLSMTQTASILSVRLQLGGESTILKAFGVWREEALGFT